MVFLLIQNWYSNEEKLSPVATNLKVNASLCLEHIAFLIAVSVFENNKGYLLGQFNK